MIADKMGDIEQRLVKSDAQFRSIGYDAHSEKKQASEDEVKNRAQFVQLQEAIAQQQQKLLQFVEQSTLDINQAQKSLVHEPQKQTVAEHAKEEVWQEIAPETRKDDKVIQAPL